MTGRPRGSVTWACTPGFAPEYIYPFTPLDHYGVANLQEFQTLLYRPLYWVGSGGKPELDDALSLAQRPVWSADGLTATVTVKPWRWSDGTVVDADAVMFWMHLLQAGKAGFGGYSPGYFPDNLAGVRKVSRFSVEFTFDRVYSRTWVLMNQLSTVTPLPKAWDRTANGPADATHDPADAAAVHAYLRAANDDRAGWADSPVWGVVNGPWRLRSYTIDGSQGEAVLVPNERYDGPNPPRLAELRMKPFGTDHEQYRWLSDPEPGGARLGYLPFEHVTEPTEDPSRGGPNPLQDSHTLVPQLTYKIHYFPVNFSNPTAAGRCYRQLYVRQALQGTLDAERAIREIYRGYGYPTNGPIPVLPDSPLLSEAQRQAPYPFDVDRARQLLAEHGWDVSITPAVCVDPERAGEGIEAGDRLSFRMRYAAGHPTLTALFEQYAKDAGAAGIEITFAEVDAAVMVVEDTTGKPGWQFADWNGGWGYGPGYHPTGEALYGTGSGVNFGSWSDPETDRLIERTVTGDDLADLHAYSDHVARRLPVIWMPNFPFRLLEVPHGLRGVEPINPYGLINPEHWYLEEDA